MAGRNDDDMKIEWEYLEDDVREESGELKDTCEKLIYVPTHHERMLQVDQACVIADDNATPDVVAHYSRCLKPADVNILKRYNGGELRKITDAVVMIKTRRRIKSESKEKEKVRIGTGTGFLVMRPGIPENAVLTNFHNVRLKDGNAGAVDRSAAESTVKKEDIEVIFFYDSAQSDIVRCAVSEISPYFSLNVGNTGNPDQNHLDFAMLFLKFPNCPAKAQRVAKITPLIPDETFRNKISLPKLNTRLVVIGHPHGAYKQIAFGEYTAETEFEDHLVVQHQVATCPGSSGSPVFQMLVNSETNQVEKNICDLQFYMNLHFRGNSQTGDAINVRSIYNDIREKILEHPPQ